MKEMFIQFIALGTLLASMALAWWHLRMRRLHEQADFTPKQHDFYRRQFRRRIQVSAMLGLLGILLGIETWVERPLILAVVGLAMLILLLWIMLLACVDAFASRMHFDQIRSDYIVEQAKLEAQARRLRAVGGNGKPHGEPIAREESEDT